MAPDNRSFVARARVPEVPVSAMVARPISEDEIRKRSVCRMQTGALYNLQTMHPEEHGLMSQKMGVIDDCTQKLCHTDFLPMKLNPGFQGHMELAMRVIHPAFLKPILKYLKRICFDCAALLVNLEVHSYLRAMSVPERWQAMENRKCCESFCPRCGIQQPKKIDYDAEHNQADFRYIFFDAELNKQVYTYLTPDDVYELLGKMDTDSKMFLGGYNKDINIQHGITKCIIVSPPQIRPTVHQHSNMPAEDDQTTLYYRIYGADKELRQALAKKTAGVAAPDEGMVDDPSEVDPLQRLRQHGLDALDRGAMDQDTWLQWLEHPPARSVVDWQIAEIRSRLQTLIFTLFAPQLKNLPMIMQGRKKCTTTKERVDGKAGHFRQHINGKRVNKSARTIIIGDSHIRCSEMGISINILMNLTTQEVVNVANYEVLLMLVRRGPKNYPGAKYIIRANGSKVTLMVNCDTVELFIGDIVGRQLLENDPLLCNRQPTLHLASAMVHRAKPVPGLAMQPNLSVTDAYNADYDGDEMNTHMPCNAAVRAEIASLMAVPYHLTSPANGTIFISNCKQDSMISMFLFTDPSLRFTLSEAQRLVSRNPHISMRRLFGHATVDTLFHPYELLSGFFPENFSIICPSDVPEYTVEIRCGQMLRGRLTKSSMVQHTKGILPRMYMDYGGFRTLEFIDQIQWMMCEFLMMRGFSVGMADLLYDEATGARLQELHADFARQWQALNDQVTSGAYTGKGLYTAAQRYENDILNLGNQHQANVQSLVKNALKEHNRLLDMIQSGARGKMANCAQLIAMYGQQLESGGRIQMNFSEGRTTPHFHRYDMRPEARGHIRHSFMEGLDPQEFLHSSIGARENQISTSVGTSKTGYLQRRLTKFMEDLLVWYDGTVRTSDGRIVQLRFGHMGLNCSRLQMVRVGFLLDTETELRQRFLKPPESLDLREAGTLSGWQQFAEGQQALMDEFLYMRDLYLQRHCALESARLTTVECAVSFEHVYYSELQLELQERSAPVAKSRCLEMLHDYARVLRTLFDRYFMGHWLQATPMFRLLFFYYLSPLSLWEHRVSVAFVERLVTKVRLVYLQSVIAPGELVGQLAGQSLGCSSTQLQLNSIHCIGGNLQSGERLSPSNRANELATKTYTSKPFTTVVPIFTSPSSSVDNQTRIMRLGTQLIYTTLLDVVETATMEYSPHGGITTGDLDRTLVDRYLEFQRRCPSWMQRSPPKYAHVAPIPKKTTIQQWCPWIVRLVLRADHLHRMHLSTQEIHVLLYHRYREDIQCIYSDTNDDVLVFRISFRMSFLFPTKLPTPPTTVQIQEKLDKVRMNMLNSIVLCGVPGIEGVGQREVMRMVRREGQYVEEMQTVLETNGSSLLQILIHPEVDAQATWTNDVHETYHVLGAFAARALLIREFRHCVSATSESNISVLVDRMMLSGQIMPATRAGIKEHKDFTTKLSFETQSAIMMEACFHGDVDFCRSPAAHVMFAREEGNFGTSAMQLVFDLDHPNAKRYRSSSKKRAAAEDEEDAEDGEKAASKKTRRQLPNTAKRAAEDDEELLDAPPVKRRAVDCTDAVEHPMLDVFQAVNPWLHMPNLVVV